MTEGQPELTTDGAEVSLSEDEAPKPGLFSPGDLVDERLPGTVKVIEARPVPVTHDQSTRKTIAMIILGVLCALYVLIVGTFLFTDKISETALTAAIASVSGLQALAAAAVGFYYGTKQGD